MKPYIIISIIIGVLLSLTFMLGLDTKAIDKVKDSYYNKMESDSMRVSDRSFDGMRANYSSQREIDELKKEIAVIKYRLEQAEVELNRIDTTSVTSEGLSKIIKSIAPLALPFITHYVGKQNKKRKKKKE